MVNPALRGPGVAPPLCLSSFVVYTSLECRRRSGVNSSLTLERWRHRVQVSFLTLGTRVTSHTSPVYTSPDTCQDKTAKSNAVKYNHVLD